MNAIAFRYNNPAAYDIKYDLQPVGTDGDVDIGDIWIAFDKFALTCPPI